MQTVDGRNLRALVREVDKGKEFYRREASPEGSADFAWPDQDEFDYHGMMADGYWRADALYKDATKGAGHIGEQVDEAQEM